MHVDPWGISEVSSADYILVTHPYYDNFSEDDIKEKLTCPEPNTPSPGPSQRASS